MEREGKKNNGKGGGEEHLWENKWCFGKIRALRRIDEREIG